VVPLGGHLRDRFGRTRVLLAANLILLAAAYPLFWLIHHQATAAIFLGQAGCALIIGVIFGASPATMAELAPRHVRVTVLSIGYNVSLALFGGTAPAAASYLIERTSDDMAPAYYMMLFAAVSLATVLSLRRGYKDDMET
ncbi:MAG: MFS transporter, partial [Pseudomonadota bacterium]